MAMRRYAFLALTLSLLAGSALAFMIDGVAKHNYTLRGYLDRVPPKTRVLDQLDLSVPDGQRRKVFITAYTNPGDPPPSDGHISRDPRRDFTLIGSGADVRRLIDAPSGAAFQGTFVVSEGSPGALQLTELAEPKG